MKYTIHSIINIILLTVLSIPLPAQVGFLLPKDTICAGETFTVTNFSSSASTYFWHFCSANLSYDPSGVNLGNIGNLDGPAFIDVAENNGTYYTFITNHTSQSVTRYNFGNSLLNNPAATDLGNVGGFIPEHVEGIQIVKNSNNNWYVFLIGGLGDDDRLIRLELGNSLDNPPTATNFGNINSTLDYPVDLFLIEENGRWLGFTVNYLSSKITRFDFGSSLANTPTAVSLGNIGQLYHPCGICAVKDGNNWLMFVTNTDSHSLTRLDFGNSLTNTPTGQNLGNIPELDSPFDLSIINDCEKTYGFVVNRLSDDVVKLTFDGGLTGNINYTSMGNIGGLYQPHGISEVCRVENEVFTFVANVATNTISRLYYETCSEPNILTSTDRDPPENFYNNPGNYNISLIVDQGLATQAMACRNIVVLEKPEVTLPKDTTICPYSILQVDAGSGFSGYHWNNGSDNQNITSDTAGLYVVEVTGNNGCKAKDSIEIRHYADHLFLGNDTSFTLGESITLDAGPNYASYQWSTGGNAQSITVIKPGDYAVNVKELVSGSGSDAAWCNYSDTIHISITLDVPNFLTPNSDGFNDTWEPKVFFHYPEAEISIFDRFGKLVAHYHGSDPGWDGTFNNKPVPDDTYWYVIDLKNGIKPITGQITIKR